MTDPQILWEMLKKTSNEYEATALRAALELMRAAEPKDPEAEREHCEAVAIALANARSPRGAGAGAANHFQTVATDTVKNERAAVRAHYEAMLAPKDPEAERKHCRDAVRCDLFNHELESSSVRFIDVVKLVESERAKAHAAGREAGFSEALNQAQDQINDSYKQLTASQAEIERVTQGYEAERVAAINSFNEARAALETKLAAALAEILRLKAELNTSKVVTAIEEAKAKVRDLKLPPVRILEDAQAKIETAYATGRRHEYDRVLELEARLENLRAATERILKYARSGALMNLEQLLTDAIKASKQS